MLPENWRIEITRSRRRTLSASVKGNGVVAVKAPLRMPQEIIYRFLEEIQPKLALDMVKQNAMRDRAQEAGYLTRREIEELAQRAMATIPERVRYYAEGLHVTYGRITIRNQKTRWGSCSSKGNLNFNCLLMLAPPEVLDYVVVHELCHRMEMNHSKRFWSLVETVLPDYREQEKWLKGEGAVLLRRMLGSA